MFLFSALTELAYVDIYGLYPHHAEGRLYIRKCRVKTNVEAFIPLHPIAEQILLLYNTEPWRTKNTHQYFINILSI